MARAKRSARLSTQPKPKVLDPSPSNTQAILRSGSEAVVYHIPVSPPSPNTPILKTTIALPSHSKWTSGLHFHATHTEYLRLVKGSIFVELDGEVHILSAEAGGTISCTTGELLKSGLDITVERFARHNWGRADEYLRIPRSFAYRRHLAHPKDRGEVVVEEWTDPADISKPLFFWNLNGVITASPTSNLPLRQSIGRTILCGWWIPFQLFVIFWEMDNWPIFLSLQHHFDAYLSKSTAQLLEKRTEYVMTFVVLFLARVVGIIFGIQAVTRERTPTDLWNAYNKIRRNWSPFVRSARTVISF